MRACVVILILTCAILQGLAQSRFQQFKDSVKQQLSPQPIFQAVYSNRRDFQDGPLFAYSKWDADASSSELRPSDTIRWHYNHLNQVVSRIARQWNADSNKWILRNREIYQYNAQQQLQLLTHFLWETNQQTWIPSFQLEYTRYPDGETQTEINRRWNTQLQSWENLEKSSWSKDQQHRDTLILIDRWNDADQGWDPFRQITISWSPVALAGLGFSIYSRYQVLNSTGSNDWELSYLEVNTFDNQGYILTSSVSTNWYAAQEQWFYNSNHQPELILIDYDDPSSLASKDSITRSFYGDDFLEVDTFTSYSLYDTVWSNLYREIYLQPDSLESVTLSYEGLNDTAWLPELRKTVQRDPIFEQELIVLDEQWDSLSKNWVLAFRTEKDYTLAGNLQQSRIFFWQDSVADWRSNSRRTNYYGLTTPIAPVEQKIPFSVFPNPARNDITVSFSPPLAGNYSLSLLSASGQIIEKHLFSKGESQVFREKISVSHLPSGLYFLTLTAPDGTSTSRLVIKKT